MFHGLDKDIITELTEIMAEDINLLFETYIADSKVIIDKLNDAKNYYDCNTVRHLAHSLKGSSSNIGALFLAKQCELLEKSSKQNDTSSANDQISNIIQAFNEIKTLIEADYLKNIH